jgi:hypothetical protein
LIKEKPQWSILRPDVVPESKPQDVSNMLMLLFKATKECEQQDEVHQTQLGSLLRS